MPARRRATSRSSRAAPQRAPRRDQALALAPGPPPGARAALRRRADERQSYLHTAEVPGADASDERWLTDPARLVALLAEDLLLFHRQPVAGCPFDQRLDAELARAAANVAAGAVDAVDFDEERAGRTPASLLNKLHAARPPDEDLVLIHGDYCFPNVVVKDWALSGFIDLGRCGVADRCHDLAQAARRGMIANALRDGIIPPDWRELVWDDDEGELN